MQSIISSEIFIITLVAGVYLAALWLYRKTRLALLHPLLVSIPALVAVMSVIGIPYESFRQGSRMINFLLAICVLSLGKYLFTSSSRFSVGFFVVELYELFVYFGD